MARGEGKEYLFSYGIHGPEMIGRILDAGIFRYIPDVLNPQVDLGITPTERHPVAAYLKGYKLEFVKNILVKSDGPGWEPSIIPTFGGGIATIVPSEGSITFGHVLEVSTKPKRPSRRNELSALGNVYRAPESFGADDMTVHTADGRTLTARVYFSHSKTLLAPAPQHLAAVARHVGSLWTNRQGRRVMPSDIYTPDPSLPPYVEPPKEPKAPFWRRWFGGED